MRHQFHKCCPRRICLTCYLSCQCVFRILYKGGMWFDGTVSFLWVRVPGKFRRISSWASLVRAHPIWLCGRFNIRNFWVSTVRSAVLRDTWQEQNAWGSNSNRKSNIFHVSSFPGKSLQEAELQGRGWPTQQKRDLVFSQGQGTYHFRLQLFHFQEGFLTRLQSSLEPSPHPNSREQISQGFWFPWGL